MSKHKSSKSRGRRRHIRIRSELRKTPDLQKIANTVLAFAMAHAEKEAQEGRPTSDQEGPK